MLYIYTLLFIELLQYPNKGIIFEIFNENILRYLFIRCKSIYLYLNMHEQLPNTNISLYGMVYTLYTLYSMAHHYMVYIYIHIGTRALTGNIYGHKLWLIIILNTHSVV